MYSQLDTVPRLLIEVDLQPVQGRRFQPTGFPDIGAAEYESGGKSYLLVESEASMANRLEAAIWDSANADLVPALEGMPYVSAEVAGLSSTNSLLEAHRLNSPYILPAIQADLAKELSWTGKPCLDPGALAAYLLKHDPNSLLHGVFFSNLKPGGLKHTRLVSSFIEAEDVAMAVSGGVKFDRLDPSGDTGKGKGNVPFQRLEYTGKITLYFKLDLHRLRAFGLGKEAESFVIALSLYKLRRLLDWEMRLRTSCDLQVRDIRGTAPTDFTLESEDELAQRVRTGIAALRKAKRFADVRQVTVS